MSDGTGLIGRKTGCPRVSSIMPEGSGECNVPLSSALAPLLLGSTVIVEKLMMEEAVVTDDGTLPVR